MKPGRKMAPHETNFRFNVLSRSLASTFCIRKLSCNSHWELVKWGKHSGSCCLPRYDGEDIFFADEKHKLLADEIQRIVVRKFPVHVIYTHSDTEFWRIDTLLAAPNET